MKNFYRYSCLIFILLFSVLNVKAQSSELGCQETLDLANSEFEAGRFYGLPSILKPCLERGFTGEQKVRAYMLLTQTYLILDDHIAAEDSYLKLLKADPEYVASVDKDPIDVVYLSKKFTATPVFTPHFRLGANTSWRRVIQEVNTDPYGNEISTKSYLRPGFQIGAGIDWNVNDNWSLCTGLGFATKSFNTIKKNISGDDELEVIEKQAWIDVPVYVKYSKSIGKIRPFGYLGYSFNLLLSDKVSLNGIDRSPSQGGNTQSTIEGQDESLMSKRNFLNRSIVVGGGAKYKVGRDFIYFDVRYLGGLSNLVKPDMNYYDGDNTSVLDNDAVKYRWVNDFFRMDNISLSVGYIRPLYDPRKIKPNKVGAFVKKVFHRKKK
jgi:hypothetical protein